MLNTLPPSLKEKIQEYSAAGLFSEPLMHMISAFARQYLHAVGSRANGEELLLQLLDLTTKQIAKPYLFGNIHIQIRAPFDYYRFGLEFFRPLIDFPHSHLRGKAHFAQITQQLARKENCILLANHQIEADPQVLSLLLQSQDEKLAEELFFVAGHRVTTDPLAVPLSLGRNLICIYSKKYTDHPPEEKTAKLQHNRRTLQELSRLLAQGGLCLYVAPSGGRDRQNAKGEIEIAPFDPASVEMFCLLARHSPRPVHFYPLALSTFHLLPPPRALQQEIGEERHIQRAAVHASLGEELDVENLGGSSSDKKERREQRAKAIWQRVVALYGSLKSE